MCNVSDVIFQTNFSETKLKAPDFNTELFGM